VFGQDLENRVVRGKRAEEGGGRVEEAGLRAPGVGDAKDGREALSSAPAQACVTCMQVIADYEFFDYIINP
jgi:hypothetical protein